MLSVEPVVCLSESNIGVDTVTGGQPPSGGDVTLPW